MEKLKAQLKQLADRIDAMSVRERGLIFMAGLVVLYMFAFNVVFAPMRAKQTNLERTLTEKREQFQNANKQLTALLGGGESSVVSQKQTKITALTKQINDLDTSMDQMTAGLVSPKEMSRLIEQMLMRNRGLELVKLESLPPKAINEELDVDAASKAPAAPVTAPAKALIYRHGMRVELKGRYIDIVEYMKALEHLPWKVFWGEVTLETDKYPVSRVSLVIYTLSRYPNWIGV